MEDVILIGHLHLVLVFLGGGLAGLRVRAGGGAGPGLRAVARLHFLGQRQLVLRLKQCPELPLHVPTGIGAELCNQIGGQLIGVMAQLVHAVAVLVIAGVGTLNASHFLPQCVFKGGIVLVGP